MVLLKIVDSSAYNQDPSFNLIGFLATICKVYMYLLNSHRFYRPFLVQIRGRD